MDRMPRKRHSWKKSTTC